MQSAREAFARLAARAVRRGGLCFRWTGQTRENRDREGSDKWRAHQNGFSSISPWRAARVAFFLAGSAGTGLGTGTFSAGRAAAGVERDKSRFATVAGWLGGGAGTAAGGVAGG